MDSHNTKPAQLELWTIRLLKIGGGIFVATSCIATFLKSSELSNKQTYWLTLILMVSSGINSFGVITGFSEKKKNYKIAMMGIIGNFLFILCTSIVVYLLNGIR